MCQFFKIKFNIIFLHRYIIKNFKIQASNHLRRMLIIIFPTIINRHTAPKAPIVYIEAPIFWFRLDETSSQTSIYIVINYYDIKAILCV